MDPQKILDYGAKLIVIFMCIPIHEYAHAWAATKLGDDTPRYQGRLSLNPLAHLDPIGALCIFFIGFRKLDSILFKQCLVGNDCLRDTANRKPLNFIF